MKQEIKDAIRMASGVALFYTSIMFIICCQVELLRLVNEIPVLGGAALVFFISLLSLIIVLLTTTPCKKSD